MFNSYGIIIGLVMLIATGLGHILVIKGEYHLGVNLWASFLIIGVFFIILSALAKNNLSSGIFGILGITFIWGILELFHQRERVEKGWFPKKSNKL